MSYLQSKLSKSMINPLAACGGGGDNNVSLAHLPIGVSAHVVSIDGTGVIVRRLLEMGIVPGAPVRVIKSAPLGDPIEVRVRGYHLALRRAEARTIKVVARDK
jgi:Fe2+ transport system protein FeoA